MLNRLRGDGENGAVLVLTALLLLVLMGFAALAVDAASGWSEKRRVQGAADLAALAAVEAIVGTYRSDVDGVVADVASKLVTVNAPGAIPTVGPATGPTATPPDPCREAQRECLTNVVVDVLGSSENAFAPAIGAADELAVGADTAEAQIYKIEYPTLPLLPVAVDSVDGSALRCAPVECVVYEEPPEPPPPGPSTTTTTTSPPPPPPPPQPPGNEVIGSSDVTLIELRRHPACDESEETTNRNLAAGADHLVGLDASADPRSEADACSDGHELTMPNLTDPLAPVPGVVTGGIEPKIPGPSGDHLWNYLTGVGICSRSEVTDLPPWVNDPEVAFMRRTAALANCFENGNPSFSIPARDQRVGWGIDMAETNFTGFVPVWIHSVLRLDEFGDRVIATTGDQGFSVFVLDAAWLSEDVTEIDPTGRLSFKLVD